MAAKLAPVGAIILTLESGGYTTSVRGEVGDGER